MGGPMRMNPPRVMGGMGPQVDTYSCPFSTRLSSGRRPKSNATGLKPCYFSLVTCAESRVLPASLSLSLSFSFLASEVPRKSAAGAASVRQIGQSAEQKLGLERSSLRPESLCHTLPSTHGQPDRWAAVCLSRTSLAQCQSHPNLFGWIPTAVDNSG